MYKTKLINRILPLIAIFFSSLCFSQKGKDLIYGKGNKYHPQFNDLEKKIDKSVYAAYTSLIPENLEIPLNKYFESDSGVTFIGVAFKYKTEELLDSLRTFGELISTKPINKDQYLMQVKIGKNVIQRYLFYSAKDGLIYLVTMIFIRQSMTLEDFELIINKCFRR